MSMPRHSDVCVRVCLRDHQKKSWKFTGEMFCEGGLAVRGPPPESGVFSAFQPPVLKRRETHSGNGDNSAVIAGDLWWRRARRQRLCSNITG